SPRASATEPAMVAGAPVGESANRSTSPEAKTVTLPKKITSFVRSATGDRISATGRRGRGPGRAARGRGTSRKASASGRAMGRAGREGGGGAPGGEGVEAGGAPAKQHHRHAGERAGERLVAGHPVGEALGGPEGGHRPRIVAGRPAGARAPHGRVEVALDRAG